MTEVVINVKNISKCFHIYEKPSDRLKQFIIPKLNNLFKLKSKRYFREFWALKEISFDIKRGETIGVIGRNGSGKSTLLQIICGTLTPTNGVVKTSGRIAALLELGSGFNLEFTGRENVYLNASLFGLDKRDIDLKFNDILEFADIGEFIDQPVKTYSSGMLVRLAFAVVVNVEPDILIVDEALAVGDLAFQRKCIRWMESFAQNQGILLFVSHSPEQVRKLCTKAIYLRKGIMVDFGNAKDICQKYEKDLHDFGNSTPPNNYLSSRNTLQEYVVNSNIPDSNSLERFITFPECAVHFDGGHARIISACVIDMENSKRNSFIVGEPFKWSYSVKFYDFVEKPVFGFMVKTKEGISLYSANSHSLGYKLSPIYAGDVITVSFVIQSNLGVGEYFLNCGVSDNSKDNNEFLYRIVDAGIVVFNMSQPSSVGIVSMHVEMTID